MVPSGLAFIWLVFCSQVMRRIWPCGRLPEAAMGLGLLVWTGWTIVNYEHVPLFLLLLAVFSPAMFACFLPRVTDFIHYDKATRLEYRGELRGNAHAAAGKWVAEAGMMQIRQYNQGIGSSNVQTFALRKNGDIWAKYSVHTELDAGIILNSELLSAFTRVEKRVNKWRMFRVTWRPGS